MRVLLHDDEIGIGANREYLTRNKELRVTGAPVVGQGDFVWEVDP